MDEQQALLSRSSRPAVFPSAVTSTSNTSATPGYHTSTALSSSDGSETSWEDYHSTCSSCSSSSHSSEEEWEESVKDNGELLFIEPAKMSPTRNVCGEVDTVTSLATDAAKSLLDKQGKFVRWIRRRESKRLRPRITTVGSSLKADRGAVSVTVTVDSPDALGLNLEEHKNKFLVKAISFDGPFANCVKISAGDILKSINGEDVSSDYFRKMNNFKFPCQMSFKFYKGKESGIKKDTVNEKRLLQIVVEGDAKLQGRLGSVPCAVLVVNTGQLPDHADVADADLVFCYPSHSKLMAARGAFLTLDHLLPTLVGSHCKTCTCDVDNESTHVVFYKEDDLLMLVGLPERLYRKEEAELITADLVTCISFTHQTLQCCFRKDKSDIEKFFSAFFLRVLRCGSTGLPDVPLAAIEPVQHHFHEFLAEVTRVPLPKEAQMQLDDALNELEACDLGDSSSNSMDSHRQYIMLGSCLYHKGYLLASHLSKLDLADVHSLLRVNGIVDLSREEGVARMVIWREVYPSSTNRGLPPPTLTPAALTPPVGRWFLLAVSSGHDILVAVLENAGCCVPLPKTPTPDVNLVREAEETLGHVQRLGLTSLAAQWLAAQNRPATTRSQPVQPRPPWPKTPGGTLARVPQGQEDTFSQTASNVSNASNASNASESDENAPILGRRAERSGLTFSTAPAAAAAAAVSSHSQSDSSDSDSDWGSFKGLSMNDNSNNLFDNPYMPSNVGDLGEITPTKITSGDENHLYHFVCVDGNEGVVVTSVHAGGPEQGLMARFTEAAHRIHAQLQHSVSYRCADSRPLHPTKALNVVKESAILIDGEKPHWIVGRLFFTPKPREVYICYSDQVPQNMLEMAFRLGLSMAG